MDFFDDLTAAIAADGAKRGIRVSPEEWQKFTGRISRPMEEAPAPRQEMTPPPVPVRSAEPTRPPRQPMAPPVSMPVTPLVEEAPAFRIPQASEIPGDWDGLRNMALNCRNCTLCNARQNVVFGEGAPNARLMFIGEGPGADEDATGRPFVGAAGQLLDKMINAMHLRREEVYIANIVKCRPPGNRMPGEDEAAACIGYLHRQIELIKPEVIVLLGGTALHFLLQTDGISRCRGRWFDFRNIAVMPTFHPAFLLRKPESKREAWHDLKLVMAKLGIPV